MHIQYLFPLLTKLSLSLSLSLWMFGCVCVCVHARARVCVRQHTKVRIVCSIGYDKKRCQNQNYLCKLKEIKIDFYFKYEGLLQICANNKWRQNINTLQLKVLVTLLKLVCVRCYFEARYILDAPDVIVYKLFV